MSQPPPEPVSIPDWLVMLVGRSTIEVEGLRDALHRTTAESTRLAAERDDLLHRADHAPDPTA